MKTAFYDGTKLLSLKDISGNKPELYLLDGNRTAGKTVFFNKLLVNRYLRGQGEFLLLFRDSTPLSAVHEGFFDDIKGLFFPNYQMTQTSMARGTIRVLLLNEKVCGYAVSMRSTELIKRMSHVFSSVTSILMDELQPENGEYNKNEVEQLFSIHTSVARGGGKMVRYVPTYLIGNGCSLINPYYVALDIHKNLRKDTKFLKGEGWVMEHYFNEVSQTKQENSGFNKALKNSRYKSFSEKNVYLDDNLAFVEKMPGNSSYLLTFRVDGKNYSCRLFEQTGILYVDDKIDPYFPVTIANSVADHSPSSKMGAIGFYYVKYLRNTFDAGNVRFKNLLCKNAFLDFICKISAKYV